MNAQVSFDIPLQIEVRARTIQLRKAPGQQVEGSVRDGCHDALLSTKQGWVRIPALQDLGLTVNMLKNHWDDLNVEVYQCVRGQWFPLEEADWTLFQPGRVR